MTVGDYLVNSLTAQSLDLPPAVSWEGRQCIEKMRARGPAGVVYGGVLRAARQHSCAACSITQVTVAWLLLVPARGRG